MIAVDIYDDEGRFLKTVEDVKMYARAHGFEFKRIIACCENYKRKYCNRRWRFKGDVAPECLINEAFSLIYGLDDYLMVKNRNKE